MSERVDETGAYAGGGEPRRDWPPPDPTVVTAEQIRLWSAAAELLAYAECEEAAHNVGETFERKGLAAVGPAFGEAVEVFRRHGYDRNDDLQHKTSFLRDLRRKALAKAKGGPS